MHKNVISLKHTEQTAFDKSFQERLFTFYSCDQTNESIYYHIFFLHNVTTLIFVFHRRVKIPAHFRETQKNAPVNSKSNDEENWKEKKLKNEKP